MPQFSSMLFMNLCPDEAPEGSGLRAANRFYPGVGDSGGPAADTDRFIK